MGKNEENRCQENPSIAEASPSSLCTEAEFWDLLKFTDEKHQGYDSRRQSLMVGTYTLALTIGFLLAMNPNLKTAFFEDILALSAFLLIYIACALGIFFSLVRRGNRALKIREELLDHWEKTGGKVEKSYLWEKRKEIIKV